MTTCNFQCTTLPLSKVVRVQSKQDKVIRKGHVVWLQLTRDLNHIGLEKQQKPLLIMCFMLSNFRVMEKDCSFRIYQQRKIAHAFTRSPIFSHTTKLGYATFYWCCNAGSHIYTWITSFIIIDYSRGNKIIHTRTNSPWDSEWKYTFWSMYLARCTLFLKLDLTKFYSVYAYLR